MAAYFVSMPHPFSSNVIGISFAVYGITGFVGGFLGGVLLDNGIDWRRILSIGLLISGICVSLLTYFHETFQVYVLLSLLGFFCGFASPSAELSIELTRGDKTLRGTAYTYARLAESFISVLLYILIVILIWLNAPQYSFTLGGFSYGLAILFLFSHSIRRLNYTSPQNILPNRSPEECTQSSQSQYLSIPSLINRLIHTMTNLIYLFKSKSFSLVILLVSIYACILQLEGSALPIEFDRVGISISPNFLLISILFLALRQLLFGLVLIPVGTIFSKLPVRKGFGFGFICYGVAMFSITASTMIFPIVFLFAVQLFTSLANASLMPTTIRATLEASSTRYHGIALALYNLTIGISAASISAIGGYFLEKHDDTYFWLIIALMCIPAYFVSTQLSIRSTIPKTNSVESN